MCGESECVDVSPSPPPVKPSKTNASVLIESEASTTRTVSLLWLLVLFVLLLVFMLVQRKANTRIRAVTQRPGDSYVALFADQHSLAGIFLHPRGDPFGVAARCIALALSVAVNWFAASLRPLALRRASAQGFTGGVWDKVILTLLGASLSLLTTAYRSFMRHPTRSRRWAYLVGVLLLLCAIALNVVITVLPYLLPGPQAAGSPKAVALMLALGLAVTWLLVEPLVILAFWLVAKAIPWSAEVLAVRAGTSDKLGDAATVGVSAGAAGISTVAKVRPAHAGECQGNQGGGDDNDAADADSDADSGFVTQLSVSGTAPDTPDMAAKPSSVAPAPAAPGSLVQAMDFDKTAKAVLPASASSGAAGQVRRRARLADDMRNRQHSSSGKSIRRASVHPLLNLSSQSAPTNVTAAAAAGAAKDVKRPSNTQKDP